jgi:sugar O-acyltransferase (sialic acid O-acetyltransferase NeuD family)
MKDIAIFGAGGFGKEIACMIRNRLPEWNIIGFFDDGKPKGQQILSFGPVLGGVDELNAWSNALAITIAIGNPITVKNVVEKITNPNISYPNIIHPNFEELDLDTFSIGKGNIIMGGCRVSCDVSIGDFNVFNDSVIIGHDVKIGSYNSFMPAVRVSGEVKIGDFNFFGVASIVLQRIKIGDEIKLSAGSVLLTKPKNGNLYMGNPAKITVF